jgi:hypothetical protein
VAISQGVPIAPSSPSRTRSLEPRVVGEALADVARTTTPPRGIADGVETSPLVIDTRAGSPLRTTEGVETSAGEVGATTSPTIIDVDPIRTVPGRSEDVDPMSHHCFILLLHVHMKYTIHCYSSWTRK